MIGRSVSNGPAKTHRACCSEMAWARPLNPGACSAISFVMTPAATLISRITQNPAQCGGRPCIRNMRIRVSDILEMLAPDVTAAEILRDFPDLELDDIRACLLFAARRTTIPQVAA